MRKNTILDGLENYFTTDIKNEMKDIPGSCRKLWSCKTYNLDCSHSNNNQNLF